MLSYSNTLETISSRRHYMELFPRYLQLQIIKHGLKSRNNPELIIHPIYYYSDIMKYMTQIGFSYLENPNYPMNVHRLYINLQDKTYCFIGFNSMESPD